VLAGRVTTVDGEQVVLDDSVAKNIDFANGFCRRICQAIDGGIAANGYDAPLADVDDDVTLSCPRPPQSLDLRAAGVDSVVWCTGYTGSFSWLDSSLTDAAGQPIRTGVAAAAPGLWYMGLRWLVRRGSGNFIGFPADAAEVADTVATYLGRTNRARPVVDIGLAR
jgi:putative flavoprotein involved in K+ transport